MLTAALIAASLLCDPAFPAPRPCAPPTGGPTVLPIRERVAYVNRITRKRLDVLLPRMMRETGIDMWILACNEDAPDPIFATMIPYGQWCPITQILVFFDRGPDGGVERLNVSRTNMPDLHEGVWDSKAWDLEHKESQWDCLARIVRERDPKRIGINEGEIQWAAGALTVPLKKKLLAALGPQYAARLESAEPLATLWGETLLEEEVDVMAKAVSISHALIAEMFSPRVVTPGHTTVDDLRFHYWQRVKDLGLELAFYPYVSIRHRSPQDSERYDKSDGVIRPGDFLHCDVGLRYMRYHTDTQQMAYVLRVGESDAPESVKRIMLETNRLQDVFRGEMRAGLTGDELLRNMLAKAAELGISMPKIYSHSLGYFLHEPGPLIGLPWEQVRNPGRGDVKLVPWSCFTVELSATMNLPEWGGYEFRVPLEEDVVFTGQRTLFLDGRQTAFHLIR